MESSDEKREMIERPLLEGSKKGGFITLPFIIANEAFEKVASYGLTPNMILYLMREYHLGMVSGTNILYLWSAATNFAPVLGAIIADSYVGRFAMIGFGSIVSLLGMILLWLTTVIPQARPAPCEESNSSCSPATGFQLLLLCTSFALMSIGAGGIRASSLAFGADQLKKGNFQKNSAVMESYFGWYYGLSTLSVIIALSCIVYIQDKMGWPFGFGIPVLLMIVSAVSFFLASPFYVKLKASASIVAGFAQVIVATFRNRHVKISTTTSYHQKKVSVLVLPSEKLRFLNKACIIRDPQRDLTPDGKAKDPWNLCTVDQVEEMKALLRVIPLWSTGTIMSINMSQDSVALLQLKSMDRHITSGFEIPAGSSSMFMIVFVIIWIALYDSIMLPIASRILGKPAYFSTRQRMGLGIFLSFLAMVVTAVMESIRRSLAINGGYADDPQAVVPMSALWLLPQCCLNGFAEGVSAVAQNEFYYSEFPRSMSSVASTLLGVGFSLASLLASFLLSIIDDLTKREGEESWISSNINKGHYDYYYWILAGLSMVNMIYFLLCCKAYGPYRANEEKFADEEDE